MKKQPFRIAIVEPQIPQNTGNIARLCSCCGCELYLVGKMGFTPSNKHLKRAGLDYWNDVFIKHFNNLEELIKEFSNNNFYYISTKATKLYTKANFKEGDFLVFGSETKGLPKEIIDKNKDNSLKIPMKDNKRSLNLANSVSIILYEAIRQTNYL